VEAAGVGVRVFREQGLEDVDALLAEHRVGDGALQPPESPTAQSESLENRCRIQPTVRHRCARVFDSFQRP
jgi:hypothetical protein